MGNGNEPRLRVLVVEDEPLIAMALEDVLADHGIGVVGPAYDLDEALRLGREESIDGAILDINIAGEKVFDVADALGARAIPFVYVTGYGREGLRDCDRNRPVLQKPYDPERLIAIARQWRRR
jgi:DNA-binding response OmpR family regulator